MQSSKSGGNFFETILLKLSLGQWNSFDKNARFVTSHLVDTPLHHSVGLLDHNLGERQTKAAMTMPAAITWIRAVAQNWLLKSQSCRLSLIRSALFFRLFRPRPPLRARIAMINSERRGCDIFYFRERFACRQNTSCC